MKYLFKMISALHLQFIIPFIVNLIFPNRVELDLIFKNFCDIKFIPAEQWVLEQWISYVSL